MRQIKIVFLFSCIPSLAYGVCNQGSLSTVVGSPFSAGSSTAPTSIAYSPLVLGNSFIATANNGNNSVSIFSVNKTTGVISLLSGFPFTVGNTPQVVAFSLCV